jgi:hypothetical protein
MHGLADPDAAVIDNAAHSPLTLGGPAVVPLTQSSDPDVGPPDGVLTLSAFASKLRDPGGDGDGADRDPGRCQRGHPRQAARALADLGPQAKDALPALRQMAASDPAATVRLVARRAIDQIESAR